MIRGFIAGGPFVSRVYLPLPNRGARKAISAIGTFRKMGPTEAC